MNPRSIFQRSTAVLTAATAALALTACGGSDDTAAVDAGPIGSTDLTAVCPATVTVQLEWIPVAEHGVIFNLMGPGAKIDASDMSVSGPLYVGGENTGVKLEIRSGGPAISFQTVASRMYQDDSIMFGVVDTDQSINAYETTPTTAVFSAFEKSPTMVMWDPETYPDVKTIADLGKTDAKVYYSTGVTYMDYLLASGQLKKSQVDSSFDGSPANFVAAGGKAAQQGFASQEPYTYENQVEGWKKPVSLELINDAGYPTYTSPLVVRTGDVETNSDCLKELVPAFQQSMVDYYDAPDETLDLILEARTKFNTSSTPYVKANGEYSMKATKDLGLVGNGSTTAYGDFDMDRVQKMIDLTTPIFEDLGVKVPADLKPADIATNEFVDPEITLPN